MSEYEKTGAQTLMTKALFLEGLRNGISSLPGTRIREIEEDIYRHFDEGAASGESEETLCAMLGDPEQLAQEYVELYHTEQSGLAPQEKTEHNTQAEQQEPANHGYTQHRVAPRGRNPILKGFIAFWMFIFGLCLPLPIFATLGAIWITLACGYIILPACFLGIVCTGIDLFIPLPWGIGDYPLINLFGGIAGMALGGLMILGTKAFGRLIIDWVQRYFRFQHRVIHGEEV